MSRDILNDIINDFDSEKFIRFFRSKNTSFSPRQEELTQYNDGNFKKGYKLGEINFKDNSFAIYSFQAEQVLSEKSGKRAQYEKGKKILRETQADAGIFIFYDQSGNFRFSLIYANYLGRRRDWSTFRRFTYFVSKEFTNKTFLQRIGDGDFTNLEKIKDAFSVEKVTKAFYTDIANWYFWAVQNVTFPKDAEDEENGRNIAVIRLITRLIFIWFMKERGLVQGVLFEQSQVAQILKDLSADKTTYYKAILQNLFFSTLNTKIDNRKYRFQKSFQGKNKDYMDHSIYRYERYFKDNETMLTVFKNIPYLNGGLFDCLDRPSKYNENQGEIRIDGFTDKDVGLSVPNYLFFSDIKEADLNKDYGTKNKRYNVRGIINILSTYNFTIDENDPNDQEVALDPELLGKVFENLLASFNPETASTARKATGSYYTPREIVDYMVTQSLENYLKTNLERVDELDSKLGQLLSNRDDINPFNHQETLKIVKLIDDLRIVDPAVGSGAFPMGILNKLVFILSKLDPDNTLWKATQLKAVEDNITDPVLRKKLLDQIEEQFTQKNFDYGRKLYLIQKCIYGVDIQQIAVEIAKLRFFISLLVDEKIDKSKENWSIEPLPNLDYKIMQGNSLVEEYEGVKLFDERLLNADLPDEKEINDIDEKVGEINRKRIQYYSKNPNWMKNAKLERPEELAILESEHSRLQAIEKDLKRLKRSNLGVDNQIQLSLQPDEVKSQKVWMELQEFHKQIFAPSLTKDERNELRQKVDELEWKLIGETLREQSKIKELEKIKKLENSNTKPFFLWKLYFPEVFKEKGGFDIVIANPPYIGEKGHKEIFIEIKRGGLSKFYQGKMDLFYFFFHLALNLGNNNSQVAFITTNYYLTALGARKLREDFKNRAIINRLVNFNELKIFEAALGQHNMITILSKGQNEDTIVETCITKRTGVATPTILESIVSRQDEETKYFEVTQKDLYDGENYDIRISGISTESHDPIQTALHKIKSQGELLGTISNINQGIVTGADKVSRKHIEKYKLNAQVGDGIFVLSEEEIKNLGLTEDEKQILKPWFKNSDVNRWRTNVFFNESILYLNRSKKSIENNVEEHLKKYIKVLNNRREVESEVIKWWQLQWPREHSIFESIKIVAPQRNKTNTFGYNEIPWYAASDVFFITEKDKFLALKYILSLINSKLYYLWLYHRGKRKGETLELIAKPLSEIPIKKISEGEQKPFIEIVDKILAITNSSDYLTNQEKQAKVRDHENQIDQLVYKLYGLTPEEIVIVEGGHSKN